MAQDFEEKRLNELALRAKYGSSAVFTRFLEPSLEKTVRHAAAQADVQAAFFGGYEGSERSVLGLWFYDEPDDAQFPVTALEITFRAADISSRVRTRQAPTPCSSAN